MKRPFSFFARPGALVASGTALIAATYGLVRLAYGLFLPDVQRSLSLGDGPAGLIAAGSSLVYCVGALVGFLLAPTRPRTTVALASASAGLGVAGMATSATSAVFGVTAVVASAGAGLASPALVRLVQRDLPAGRADGAQAVVNSGTGPGLVVAGLLALVLLPDWRTAWTAAAIVTVLTGAAVLVADAHTHPRRHVREDHPQPVGLPPWNWFVAHGRLVVVALLLGTGSAAVWTYGRSLLVDAGAPASLSVLAWTALGVGGAAVALTARVLGRLRARTAWTVTSAAVAVATLGLGLAPVAPPRPSSRSRSSRACCSAGATPRRPGRSSRGRPRSTPGGRPRGRRCCSSCWCSDRHSERLQPERSSPPWGPGRCSLPRRPWWRPQRS